MNSALAICRLLRPAAASSATRRSPGVSRSTGAVARRGARPPATRSSVRAASATATRPDVLGQCERIAQDGPGLRRVTAAADRGAEVGERAGVLDPGTAARPAHRPPSAGGRSRRRRGRAALRPAGRRRSPAGPRTARQAGAPRRPARRRGRAARGAAPRARPRTATAEQPGSRSAVPRAAARRPGTPQALRRRPRGAQRGGLRPSAARPRRTAGLRTRRSQRPQHRGGLVAVSLLQQPGHQAVGRRRAVDRSRRAGRPGRSGRRGRPRRPGRSTASAGR